MKPSVELSKRINALIDSYCSQTSPEPVDLKRLASQYRVLPVLIDWSGFFGLQQDGEILVVPTEEGEEAKIEIDGRVRRIAVYRGTKKYPELKELVPARPFDASDCYYCEGHGELNLTGFEPDTIVCYCGGLGWLTLEEAASELRG